MGVALLAHRPALTPHNPGKPIGIPNRRGVQHRPSASASPHIVYALS
jgi:hypothetical protein